MTEESRLDLLSLVLELRPSKQTPAADFLGRAAHALLLQCLSDEDPKLADRFHESSGARPFSCSSLLGSRQDGISPEQNYLLRFTALEGEVAQALIQASVAGRLQEGASLQLAEAMLRVEGIATKRKLHPWAGSTSYEELSAPWLLAKRKPSRRIRLRLSSPTTFRSSGLHVPFPMPDLVFGSLLRRWNAFSPVSLPEDLYRYASECLAISRYDLRTRTVPGKGSAIRKGAIGWIEFIAVNPDRYWLSLVNLLADFALYSGVGAGTSAGLGQVRLETPVFHSSQESDKKLEEKNEAGSE